MSEAQHIRLIEQNLYWQEQTAAGSEKAFEQLYRLHKDRVYEIALLYTRSPVYAEEILQDIFVQVWTQRAELPGIRDFAAWIFLLTRNRSFNVLRGIARSGQHEKEMVHYWPQDGQAADTRLLTGEAERQVRQALALLTPAQRQAFELVKLKGYTREETAATMGISPNTAKVHLLHAMRVLRAHFLHKDPGALAILAIFPLFL